jgi:hypothetical protein
MEMATKREIKNVNTKSVVNTLMQQLKKEAAADRNVRVANILLMLQLRNCSASNASDCPLYEKTTQKFGFVSSDDKGKVSLITSASLVDAYKVSLPKAKVGTTALKLKGNLLIGMSLLIARTFPKTETDPYLVNPTERQKGTVKLKNISDEALNAIIEGKYSENSDKIADHTVTLEMTPTPGMDVKVLAATNVRCENTLVAIQDVFLPIQNANAKPMFLQVKTQATEAAEAAKPQTRIPLEAKLSSILEGAPILNDRGEYLGVVTKASADSKGLSLGSCVSTK